MAADNEKKRLWLGRFAWLVGIWCAGIAVLAMAAWVLRQIMNAAGLTA